MLAELVDHAISIVSPDAALRRRRARQLLKRAHEGASKTDGWKPRRAGASANADHRADARELRVRARSLVQNVPYVGRGLPCLVSSTIGTGITPQALGKNAQVLDTLFAQWASVADADGIFDFFGLQAAAYRAMEQDGEVLVRRRSRLPSDGLPVPLQVQLLEIDWLDSDKNGSTPDGGVIVNGVEYDVLGRVRQYWLFGSHPGDATLKPMSRLTSAPVPARDILHLFAPSRPGQGRGITRLAPVIARCRDLMLYEDAELQRKNLETRLGVIASGDVSGMENPPELFGASSDGTPLAQRTSGDLGVLPSGGITQLPAGLNLTAFEPKTSGDYAAYVKMQLHLIACGIGVPYEALTGDMVEVNFSSARVRLIDFRRDCEQMQWLVVVPRLCAPLWRWFIDAAVLAGKLARADYGVDWSTPRWDYVNPKDDVKADVDAIGAGLLSPSEALRRRGYKPEQVFAEIGRDFEALEASGAISLMRLLLSRGVQLEPADANPLSTEA
jgi:lambda family phage portal protein